MPNWYASRDETKRAGGLNGTSNNIRIDRNIEAASRLIDRWTRRFFIPRTETRLYRWVPWQARESTILELDQGLISVTTLQTQAQDSSPTTVSSDDYFLEPNNTGPPYNRIEIDLSSSSAFEAGDTPQRSISVAGSWGYENDTESASTLAAQISTAAATSLISNDGSVVDVGDTLLIESEQVFVTEETSADSTATLSGNPTASMADVTIAVNNGALLNEREVILVDSERMYIETITGNNLTVQRAYDGSTLAAHTSGTAVNVFRVFTITRGVNGTTAATHAISTAMSRYVPPLDIRQLCIAESLAAFHQDSAGWGRQIGAGDGATEYTGRSLASFRKEVVGRYLKLRSAVI